MTMTMEFDPKCLSATGSGFHSDLKVENEAVVSCYDILSSGRVITRYVLIMLCQIRRKNNNKQTENKRANVFYCTTQLFRTLLHIIAQA